MNPVAEMRSAIQAAIAEAQECDGKLRITFKREKTGDLMYLLGMISSGIITLNPGDHAVVMAVSQSRDWEFDDNRTMNVTMTPSFREEFFVGRLARALEKIEVVRSPQGKKPKSNVVRCQTCQLQMRPKVEAGGCNCNIERRINDLLAFDYVPVKTQKKGALRKMKSPEGKTIREEFFGAEVDKLLLG